MAVEARRITRMRRESGESSPGGYAPDMDTRRPLRTLAIALGTAGLLISGCSSGSSTTGASSSGPAATASPVPAALKTYYAQHLSWRDCGVTGFQCTTMKAPLDYAKPDAGEIKLAVSRKKATGPGKRIGSLLVNPGGPGGSAIEYLQGYAAVGYPAQVRARYDMVAIDPAGWRAANPSPASPVRRWTPTRRSTRRRTTPGRSPR